MLRFLCVFCVCAAVVVFACVACALRFVWLFYIVLVGLV